MCRTRREDASLHRVGLSDQGWYLGRGSGRGLWWCAEGPCGSTLTVHHAQKALRRSLRDEEVSTWRAFADSSLAVIVVKE